MKKFLYLNEFPSDLQTLKDEISKDLTVGIEFWSVWLQMNKNKKYYLHYYQGRSLDPYVDRLLPLQNSEQVLELDFYLPEDLPECTYPYCFFYPLLPDKVEDHREYCRRAMRENREQTTRACQAFGLVHLSKWIQRFNQCYYVLYTQVFNAPIQQCRQNFLSLQNDPDALKATATLREHTGLSFVDLFPEVKKIYSASI